MLRLEDGNALPTWTEFVVDLSGKFRMIGIVPSLSRSDEFWHEITDTVSFSR